MAASVAHFVAFEVGVVNDIVFRTGSFAALRQSAFVAVVGMVTVIHMALEVLRTMEPPAGSDEDSAVEPLRAIVAVGSAAVRGGIVVAVRTIGGSDFDVDLGLGCGGGCRESETCNSGKREYFYSVHKAPLSVRGDGEGISCAKGGFGSK